MMNIPKEYTPGPWKWTNFARGEWVLWQDKSPRLYVLDFVRKGMQGATPRVRREPQCIMTEFDPDHPDARLIAMAPELAAENARLREELARLKPAETPPTPNIAFVESILCEAELGGNPAHIASMCRIELERTKREQTPPTLEELRAENAKLREEINALHQMEGTPPLEELCARKCWFLIQFFDDSGKLSAPVVVRGSGDRENPYKDALEDFYTPLRFGDRYKRIADAAWTAVEATQAAEGGAV